MMFSKLLMTPNPAYKSDGPGDSSNLRGQALSLFSTMEIDGKVHRIIQTLKRKPSRLLDLASSRCASCVPNQHYAGHMGIPIDHIRGSEGRTEDFDDTFYMLHDRMRSRWLSVAILRLAGEGLPLVELIHSGGIYFVRDGHLRISIAKALARRTSKLKSLKRPAETSSAS